MNVNLFTRKLPFNFMYARFSEAMTRAYRLVKGPKFKMCFRPYFGAVVVFKDRVHMLYTPVDTHTGIKVIK